MKSDFREFKTVEIEDYNSEELDKNVEYIPVKNKLIEETETDYEKISIEEILKFHKIPIYTEAETQPIFSECLNVNQYYKFYLAKNSHLKNCSLMVLNNVDTKKRTFGLLLENLCRLDSLDCKFILKLKGANVINNTKVYLLFDLIMGSYLKKKKEDDVSFNYKFCILYYLIETVFVLHDNLIPAEDLRFSLFNIDNYEELKFLPPFEQLKEFDKNFEGKKEKVEPEHKFDRYISPEKSLNFTVGLQNDIWMMGCIIIEVFSNTELWANQTKEEMLRELKKGNVPKIPPDIPKNLWGLICECLNPFTETRLDAKELFQRYVKLMVKMKIPELFKHLEKHSNDEEIFKLNQTKLEDVGDPKGMRKCSLHPKYDAMYFCAKCADVICEQCKNTIHTDHLKKGFIFEYTEFINQSQISISQYRDKFIKYMVETNVPERSYYDNILKSNAKNIETLYMDQITKIDEQFKLFSQLLNELKDLEIKQLGNVKDYVKGSFETILNNYTSLNTEKEQIIRILDIKEQEFEEFENMDQVQKEQIMRDTIRNEEVLVLKKKNIIKYVQTFNKDSWKIETLKRYFEIHIDKYKENRTNDIVKALEKKIVSIKKKYSEMHMDSYFNGLITEFDDLALTSSRSYFSAGSRELISSITNTKKIFSYSIDQGKYHIEEVDFSQMPFDTFPNYSRSLLLNGNLLISGGYDDQTKIMLPYFFYYDSGSKHITRLNDMNYGRTAHSIIYISPHFIIAVAGSGIVKCEKYNMETNTWKDLPDLSLPRQNCSLFYFNKQFLYVFGGAFWNDSKNAFNFIESVERLNLGFGTVEGSDKWEEIKTYSNPINLNIKKSVMSCLSYSTKKILLVGGNVAYNNYSDECLCFDFEKNEFSLSKIKLPMATCFPNKAFTYFNEKAYQLDNQGHVFEFDFKKDNFNIIKENNIVKSKTKE